MEILGASTGRSAKLCAESDLAMIIKAIATLREHRVGALEGFYVARIDARGDFVGGMGKDLARVHFIFGRTRAHAHER